jgi:phosphopantothenate-cysteine ligase
MDRDEYFTPKVSSPPAMLSTHRMALDAFVSEHTARGTPLVLVSCGGTTVPLETNTVRFLDNFSTGGRGGKSAEHFLELGYAVVFLHRTGASTPFACRFQDAVSRHVDLKLLDSLSVSSTGVICMDSDERLVRVLRSYTAAKDENRLLSIPFTTIHEYLWLLRETACALAPMRSQAMLYLAAAVSDFFQPESTMAQHKIQSATGGLELALPQVPKLLGAVHSQWAPDAYCVSFKLETDKAILLQKARGAIEKYGMHLVVANELHSRNRQVVLVEVGSERLIEVNKTDTVSFEMYCQNDCRACHALNLFFH